MKFFCPVVCLILILTILSALINVKLNGPQSLSLMLWTVAGMAMLVVLTSGYITAAEIDRLDNANHKNTVRAHILLHVVPLTYFPIVYAVDQQRALETIYLIPIILFFVSGVRTWKQCHRIFGTKLYKVFQIGNRQMLILFPAAFAVDMAGWPIEGTEAFSHLMHVYFIVHFILTGITVSLMRRDQRRCATGSVVLDRSDNESL